MPLQWDGDKLVKRIERLSKKAIDEVIHEAAEDARTSHWWQTRTGRLQANIVEGDERRRGSRYATSGARRVRGTGIIRGRFGTTRKQGFYGLFLEYRHKFLRSAADRHFPTLAAKLKKNLEATRR